MPVHFIGRPEGGYSRAIQSRDSCGTEMWITQVLRYFHWRLVAACQNLLRGYEVIEPLVEIFSCLAGDSLRIRTRSRKRLGIPKNKHISLAVSPLFSTSHQHRLKSPIMGFHRTFGVKDYLISKTYSIYNDELYVFRSI
jgi:hypothetical protein